MDDSFILKQEELTISHDAKWIEICPKRRQSLITPKSGETSKNNLECKIDKSVKFTIFYEFSNYVLIVGSGDDSSNPKGNPDGEDQI